jgi:hypothetical protein
MSRTRSSISVSSLSLPMLTFICPTPSEPTEPYQPHGIRRRDISAALVGAVDAERALAAERAERELKSRGRRPFSP